MCNCLSIGLEQLLQDPALTAVCNTHGQAAAGSCGWQAARTPPQQHVFATRRELKKLQKFGNEERCKSIGITDQPQYPRL